MNIIVDSNIIYSALLNTQSTIGDILLNSQETFTFVSCEYLREEIENHKEKIIKHSGYTESEYREIEYLVLHPITFVLESLIRDPHTHTQHRCH